MFPSRIHPTVLWALGLLDIDLALLVLTCFLLVTR